MTKKQNRTLSLLLSLLLVFGVFTPILSEFNHVYAATETVKLLKLPIAGWKSKTKGWGRSNTITLINNRQYLKNKNPDNFYAITTGHKSGPALYCIEPTHSIGEDLTVEQNRQAAIDYLANMESYNAEHYGKKEIYDALGRVLHFGYSGNLNSKWNIEKASDKKEIAKYLATQQLVWEVVVGERDLEFKKTNMPSGKKGVGNQFKSGEHPIASDIQTEVKNIEEAVQKRVKRPSFLETMADKAKIYDFGYDKPKKQFKLTLTDANKVVDKFTYTVTGGSVTVTPQGNNKLILTSQEAVTSPITIKATKKEQSTGSKSKIIVWSYKGEAFSDNMEKQPLIEEVGDEPDPIEGYVKAKSGDKPTTTTETQLTKTSEDDDIANKKFTVEGTYEEEIPTWNAETQQYDYKWVQKTFSKQYVTDSNGGAKLDGMPKETSNNAIRNEKYIIKETGTPLKYKQPDDQKHQQQHGKNAQKQAYDEQRFLVFCRFPIKIDVKRKIIFIMEQNMKLKHSTFLLGIVCSAP